MALQYQEDKHSKRRLCIVITASPVPSHPSRQLIETTIRSLENLTLPESTRIVLAHDGPRKPFSPTAERYTDYLKALTNELGGSKFEVLRFQDWSHLSGTWNRVISEVRAEYFLVMQHDLPFVRPINMVSVLDALDEIPEVKHLRFNKRLTVPAGWDAADSRYRIFPIKREFFFKQRSYQTTSGDFFAVQTLAWSDQNFIAKASYFESLVFPLTKNLRIFPERILDPLNKASTHKYFGTFVYGKRGDAPYIAHLDGRESRSRRMGKPKNVAKSLYGRLPRALRLVVWNPRTVNLGKRLEHASKWLERIRLRTIGNIRFQKIKFGPSVMN